MLLQGLIKSTVAGILLVAMQGSWAAEGTDKVAVEAAGQTQDYFARVDGHVITQEQFRDALRENARNRFYHARVPDAELVAFEQEIADKLVNDYLLVKEAKRRGVEPDVEQVEQRLARVDELNEDNAQWLEVRETLRPEIEEKFRNESLLQRIEAQVRDIGTPALEDVRRYYEQNPDKFTQPGSSRMAVILLRVDPSAGGEAWKAAADRAESLVKELREGADFAEMAQLHSDDFTADQGGDMGFQHDGMIAGKAQVVIDELEIGAITDPIPLLDGIAIFKLLDRIPPKLQPFENVQERATGLYLRESEELAWKSLIFQLRENASIEINQGLFTPTLNTP